MESTKPGKIVDELLVAYSGREDELLKNLTMTQAKQEKDAQRSEVAALNTSNASASRRWSVVRRRLVEVICRRRAREAKAKVIGDRAKKKLRELAVEVDKTKEEMDATQTRPAWIKCLVQ